MMNVKLAQRLLTFAINPGDCSNNTGHSYTQKTKSYKKASPSNLKMSRYSKTVIPGDDDFTHADVYLDHFGKYDFSV